MQRIIGAKVLLQEVGQIRQTCRGDCAHGQFEVEFREAVAGSEFG